MAVWRPRVHSSRHAPETNMSTRQSWANTSRHALGTNMADSRPRVTAPAMTREPTWPAGALSPQLAP